MKDCSKCFYYHHIEGRKPFCFKYFRYDPEPCDHFRKLSCQDCLHGRGFEQCQLKEKPFPKKNYCKDFHRYERWSFDEV